MLFLNWIIATGAAGFFIGYMAAPTDFFWELIASGFVVGIAQWVVLQRYIKSAVWWIPISGFGWILGIFLMIFTRDIFNPVVDFLTSVGGLWGVFWLNLVRQPINFAVFGFAQWLVLRHHFRYGFWWIFASALSGAFRGALGSYACAATCKIGRGSISNGLGWAASAAITGIVLVWLIENHYKNLPSG
ncbi:hypothetical protein NIES267_31360 [Calothrix parasitica NIES-267]|uniref:Uncharacterized protein n=1 Tax=Calothrix parasitica NIES-267 TaxID=1973488 RepID=A0A1Z4LQY8_9CYAN|nr:hypothetical protein NIES267_31360 [Calothrix parasitica NIES-267]